MFQQSRDAIAELEANGLRVFISHSRFIQGANFLYSGKELQDSHLTSRVRSYGGRTDVRIVDAETKEILAEADATCSAKDSFNKSKGIAIALGRAMKLFETRVTDESPRTEVPVLN